MTNREMEWPTVRLGEVLSQVQRVVVPQPGTVYRQIGVRLWGEGAYEREPMDGAATKYAALYEALTGDLIVNKIWARNGSVAVVDDALSGCVGSGEFPMFAPQPKKVHPRWMHWLTKWQAFWVACAQKSQGTSGQNRIKPEQILQIEIPLPTLLEQQHIVARIDELASQISEAHSLREGAARETDALCLAMFAQDASAVPTPLRELVVLRTPEVTVQRHETYQFAGVYSFGRGVFRGARKSGADFAYSKLTRLRAGDFVYPKLMAWEGAFGVVPPACDSCVVSPEFPVFEVNRDKVLPEVLDIYFRNPRLWPEIAGESTGTNVRRRRLNPMDFLSHKMPLPSKAVQRGVCGVHEQVKAIQLAQAETVAELDALLPAILARAFTGRL